MKPNLTTVFKPNLVEANNNQTQIKNLQEGVAKLTPKIEDKKPSLPSEMTLKISPV